MELTNVEQQIIKEEKKDIMAYYNKKIKKLQDRIDYLGGKEFYESIEVKVIQEERKRQKDKHLT